MSLISRDKRRVLAGRARAELLKRQRERNFRGGEGAIFYDAMPKLTLSGCILAGRGLSVYSKPIPSQMTAGEEAEIRIGDGVAINYGVDIYAEQEIEIGDGTMVGTMVSIFDTNFHPVDENTETKKGAVRIGRNVWLGRAVLVLPGVEIGDHSVVAAGSVVARDVPPRTVVAGNPATVKRELRAGESWMRNSAPS